MKNIELVKEELKYNNNEEKININKYSYLVNFLSNNKR
jgi:hypothetical protein